jgi:purine/pyrimidine-nucleoside phosphorylase
MSAAPEQFENVTVVSKANVYFDGKVVSHTVLLADGARKTLGLIYPGTYTFNTGVAERMDITAGACRYRLAGQKDWTLCTAGAGFRVPGASAFDIAVDAGLAQYVCSFE